MGQMAHSKHSCPLPPPAILAVVAASLIVLYVIGILLPSSSPPAALRVLSPPLPPPCGAEASDLTVGRWARDPVRHRGSLYDESCPFHRNAWNCLRNGREHMDAINSWSWIPDRCGGAAVPRINPASFLERVRGRRIGFVGDSLNENFLVAFLCTLRLADAGARKWKRKGAWRGGYFPKFDVTVAYHRAVLLANYTWQPIKDMRSQGRSGGEGFYRVNVDVPADDWVNITNFYDILVFNTGHWWGLDKFPETTPLIFFRDGKPIDPPLGILDGLEIVLQSMISYIEKEVPRKSLKFWRTQSPRHFYSGEWDHNGTCLFNEPLRENELDLWFDPSNGGVNKEARRVNSLIRKALLGTSIRLLNLTHMSEFRADAHPATWLGKKDAVAIWGQDCMHWCLPGVPDTWVDILAAQVMYNLEAG